MKRSKKMIEAAKKKSFSTFNKRARWKLANKNEDKINKWLMSCESKSLDNSSKFNSIKDTTYEVQKKFDLSVNRITDNYFDNDKVTNWLNTCEPHNFIDSRDIEMNYQTIQEINNTSPLILL